MKKFNAEMFRDDINQIDWNLIKNEIDPNKMWEHGNYASFPFVINTRLSNREGPETSSPPGLRVTLKT